MITAIAASLTAIKESLGLVKVIRDASVDLEIQNATNELQRKLTDLLMENTSLAALLSEQQKTIIDLEKKQLELEDFKTQAREYKPCTLESGTFTYVNNPSLDEAVKPHYLCANCYRKRVISVLQPKGARGAFYNNFCPSCQNEYLMNKKPASSSPVGVRYANAFR
ncbi:MULTISPECIES: hypothetical protein [Xenorhabdus]|uniref:hypothetical protein n=1 Tax=Xenorhabdus TaxID=626 RepID=UPI00064A91BA|nr:MULTISPECIES: hypothetical protein [Xenorhabdus]KLU13878.1 hypothetical protein AAY47_19685 [Xenorhabdus griffiniae]KOP34628.1 hypothetical protein AFK69_03550 [Xenorhabdus sp. GDc328]